jgi:hypothetical protein
MIHVPRFKDENAADAVQLIGQHPALKFGTIFEIRPAGDMSEIMKASEQRRRQVVAP